MRARQSSLSLEIAYKRSRQQEQLAMLSYRNQPSVVYNDATCSEGNLMAIFSPPGDPDFRSTHSGQVDPVYRPFAAWWILILLTVFMVINFSDRILLALVAQPVIREFGLTSAQFGLISSSFYFLYSVSAVGIGFLATRHISLKWLLFAMSLLWAATQLPVFLFASGGVLLGTRVALGAAEGPATAVANSTAYSWFPEHRRGLPTSILTSGASLAKLLVAPLLTLLLLQYGWRSAFLAMAISGIAWGAAWAFFGKTGPYAAVKPPTASTPAGAAANRATRRRTFLYVVRSRTFVILLIATYPGYALMSVILTWLPSYLEVGLGFSPLTAGVLFGLPSLVGMACMVSAGYVTDKLLASGVSSRVARGMVPTLSLAFGGLLLTLLPFAGNERYVAYVILVMGYCLTLPALPLVYAAIGSAANPAQRTSVLSLFIALQSTSGIIAPWATGALIDSAENQIAGYNAAFLVLGALCVAGGLLAARFVDPARDTARTED
ncbi:MFS transporter [Rhodococcus ruber]|uniref:MFS transporter n=1 Tax=Rhodococcus ruber TaxID=1830 RepID=A0ABT4MI81_9NOCA|nr:MFS transporter [Rhodococcus ruber]MCZ4519436.1 MFS transporter [Rhodococcus ruber]